MNDEPQEVRGEAQMLLTLVNDLLEFEKSLDLWERPPALYVVLDTVGVLDDGRISHDIHQAGLPLPPDFWGERPPAQSILDLACLTVDPGTSSTPVDNLPGEVVAVIFRSEAYAVVPGAKSREELAELAQKGVQRKGLDGVEGATEILMFSGVTKTEMVTAAHARNGEELPDVNEHGIMAGAVPAALRLLTLALGNRRAMVERGFPDEDSD